MLTNKKTIDKQEISSQRAINVVSVYKSYQIHGFRICQNLATILTYWGSDRMAAILHKTLSSAFNEILLNLIWI